MYHPGILDINLLPYLDDNVHGWWSGRGDGVVCVN